jgi:putative polyhydroxyalkanoate system protein
VPDIHIHRDHQLGFKEARKIAFSWAEKAEEKFDMECTYEEGDTEDTLHFSRSGVTGTLLVDAKQFEMKAQLGFLFGAFKDRIEAEIGEQLDALLNKPAAKKAAAPPAGAKSKKKPPAPKKKA